MRVNGVRGVRWAGLAVALVGGAAAPGAAAGEAPASRPAPATAPSITITGRRAPVEQGEKSIFRALQPRDLFQRPLTESPGLDTSVSVVGSEQIDWQKSFSLVDALKYVPGAWTERRGRKVKEFFSVRGQRYPYPGYLIDGAWFREFHETPYFISAANVDRIEVLRSSAAMLLSPGGMAGMVHVIPRTYERRRTSVQSVYGTDNTTWTDVSHGGALEKLSYALGAGFRHTDGPDHENAAENITNLYARLVGKPAPQWTFTVTGMSFFGDRELQLAEPPASAALQTRHDQFDPMQAYLFVGKARYEPSDRLATEVVANYGLRRFHGQRDDEPRWLEKDYEYGTRVTQVVKIGEANTLRFGGMFNHWVSPTGKRFYWGRRGDLWTLSGVIVDEHDFGPVAVNGGYRFSRTFYDDFGGLSVEGSASGLTTVKIEDEWEDPLHTFTLGGAWRLGGGLSLHGNVTRGQIAATPGMLDADLRPPGIETRTKWDLGVRKAWDAFGEASLTGFYVDQKDAAVLTSKKVTINGVDHGLYENADGSNYGLELDVRSKRFAGGLQFFFNAVVMQTEIEDDAGRREDQEVPEVVLGGGVSWLLGNVELSVLAKHVNAYENERFLPRNAAPAELGDFTEVNAQVTYHFGTDRQHHVFFGVDNIFDDHYSTVAGWPDEGIRVKGGVSLNF